MFGGLSLFLVFVAFDALATSSHERFLNWTGAFDIIKHNFWQGVGPGQFPAAYELYRPMGSNITRYAHSFPLQLTAELGIWAWFWQPSSMAFFLKQSCNSTTVLKKHLIWLLGLVVALWVHNLVDYGFQHPQTVTLLALVTFLAFPPNESVTTVSPMTHRSRLALLALFGVFMAYGIVFLAQRNQVLQNSRNLTESAEPLADWIGKYPTDFEALIAMMARTHSNTSNAQKIVTTGRKRVYISVIYGKNKTHLSLPAGYSRHESLSKTRGLSKRVDTSITHSPYTLACHRLGNSIGAFSHDPNYATWYKEAAQWLHGTYHLKGFKQP